MTTKTESYTIIQALLLWCGGLFIIGVCGIGWYSSNEIGWTSTDVNPDDFMLLTAAATGVAFTLWTLVFIIAVIISVIRSARR